MATGRVYSVSFEGVATTAATDLFELSPADDKPIRLLGMTLGQSSDVGDAAEEVLRFEIIRGYTSSGSGGSAATPIPMRSTASAAGCGAEVNNTTGASAGTAVILMADTFNIRSGYQVWFPPECQPEASQGNTTILVRLMAAPTDSLTMSGTLFFEELG